MEFLQKALMIKKWITIILGILCILELVLLLYKIDCMSVEEGLVNLNNTTCSYSENLGRRIFLHVCGKDGSKVYDIRYFWHQEEEYLKPERIGVQLTRLEFNRLCALC